MNKQSEKDGSLVLEILSAPLGDILSSLGADATFLLYVAHDACKVRFVGLNKSADPQAAQILKEVLEKKRIESADLGQGFTHQRLFELISQLANESELSGPRIYGAAVHWLESDGLALGSIATSAHGSNALQIPHWTKLGGAGRPLIRSQDALDWAATFNLEISGLQRERRDTCGYTNINHTVLRVPQPAERENLVTPDNLHIFLAEHILSLGQEVSSETLRARALERQTLTFYFLPLKGLGQWRAAIDWIEREPNIGALVPEGSSLHKTLEREVTPLTRMTLEYLFSLLLLNSFGGMLRTALAAEPSSELAATRSSPALFVQQLAEAFSLLWLSTEVQFFRKGDLVYKLQRHSDGSLVPSTLPLLQMTQPSPHATWIDVDQNAYPGFFSYSGESHPGLTHIRLKLEKLVNGRPDEQKVLEAWPFNEVQYSCYLFQAQKKEVARWSDQLAQRIETIIRDHMVRQKALSYELAEAYEGSGHVLKSAISLTGWKDTLEEIREQFPESTAVPISIQKAENTLSLFSIFEAFTGLQRLVGILSHNEYQKLASWFDEDSLAAWGMDEAMEDYTNSLIHLTQSIGCAHGRPWVEVSISNSEPKLIGTDCRFDPDLLSFPPLSRATKDEAAFALLPAFIEPLRNALHYLRNLPTQNEEPIRIFFEDHRREHTPGIPPHILVKLGNLCPDVHHKDPSGVETTRRLVKLSYLATMQPSFHDGTYRWVPILLHPLELYHKIAAALPQKKTGRKSRSAKNKKEVSPF